MKPKTKIQLEKALAKLKSKSKKQTLKIGNNEFKLMLKEEMPTL